MITNLTRSEKDCTHKNENCLKLKNCANSLTFENEKENTTNIIANENIFGFEKEKDSWKKLRKRKVQGKGPIEREAAKRLKILSSITVSEEKNFDKVSNSHCKEPDTKKPSVSTIDFEKNKNRIAELTEENLDEMFPSNYVFNRRESLDSKCNFLKGDMDEESENTFLDIEINTPKIIKPSYEAAEVPSVELPSVLNGILLSCRVIDRSSGLETNISPCLVCEEKEQSFSTKDDGQSPIDDKFYSRNHKRGYHFIKLLRDCIYGKVYIAKSLDWSDYYQQFVYSEDCPWVAIKCIDRSKIDYPEFKMGGTGGKDKKLKGVVKTTTAEDAIREISLLQLVSSPGHQNVQSVTDVIMDVNCVYLISPYYSGGELFNHVDNIINKQKLRFPQEQVKKYMRGILSGVKYLHRETKICHHDLSLENILLDEKGSPVIIDFGMACKLPGSTETVNSSEEGEISVESTKSTFEENPSDNLSIITDREEFFDFDEPEDLMLRPSTRTGETFYQHLSDLFFANSKPKVKSSCSLRSDSSRSTLSDQHLQTVLERVSTPETIIDAGMSGTIRGEYNNIQTSLASQNLPRRKLKIKSRGARIGKITYMTPEIWNNEDFDGEAIDMWACGIILFILLVGFPPMEEPSGKDHRFTMIMKGELYVLLKLWGIGPDIVSTEALDLINKLVRRNPWERLSVEEALAHPYLQ